MRSMRSNFARRIGSVTCRLGFDLKHIVIACECNLLYVVIRRTAGIVINNDKQCKQTIQFLFEHAQHARNGNLSVFFHVTSCN